ncbi:MAG: membrane-bound lytic murein transglycosylase MltF [Sinobacteraceae bacterium]|nr:membrane-bound lytic murein transglycosylase MltF [Nevskiaceae bacterium]
MTASVPLRPSPGFRGGGILAESLRAKASFVRCALVLVALLTGLTGSGCGKSAPPALDAIRARGELRVATLNLPTCYYLGAERTEGLEFELASAYAARLGVKLNMYPLENERALQAELDAGRADLAAASLTNNPAWSRVADAAGVYARIPQLVVYERNGVRPRETLQLESARLAVRADSAQERILQHLRSTVAPQLNWEQTAPSAADPVEDVDSGQAQYAIVDAREFSFARHLYPNVQVGFALPEERPVQWMVRRNAPGLLASVNAFFRDLQYTGRLAQLLQQSSGDTRPFAYEESREFQQHVAERLPQYRAWFEKAAAENGLDWRLLAAIGYQESKWDPRAQSDEGARGVMMLTAATAQSLGLKDRSDAEQSIYAGARYLAQVRDKVPERIPEPDRTWLTIAAYNVGFGHLEDARIITQSLGKDPDSWAEVRLRLPLLAQERWYTRARRGYARGWEPVQFVDRIQRYLRLLEWQPAESATAAASAPAAPSGAVPASTAPGAPAAAAPGTYAAGS